VDLVVLVPQSFFTAKAFPNFYELLVKFWVEIHVPELQLLFNDFVLIAPLGCRAPVITKLVIVEVLFKNSMGGTLEHRKDGPCG
jgi:hypothetical protein